MEDSYNLGYVIRSLYAFGCDGIILKDHIVDFDDSTIIKSSAGASEMLPICHVGDLQMALEVLKSNGIRVISAYRGGDPICLYDYDFTEKGILICLGGPMRGLSRVILDNSDDFIYIPYASDFRNALNGAGQLIDDTGDAIERGADSIQRGLDNMDDGMTNSSTTSTTYSTTTTTTRAPASKR